MSDELRELDFQIAERVFGRDRLTARVDPMNRDGEPQYYWGYPTGHDFAPFYSTDVAAAFEVVERLRGEFAWDIESWTTPAFTGWHVQLWKNGDIAGEARDESLPFAICRAALETVASVVKDQNVEHTTK